MPSYKIHSLKDSHKLSFIIEGENETSLKQKLSSEGYIVLSVEQIDIKNENVFIFEGKKPDKSFIEGKIAADNMFSAYEMLTKDYSYTISRLYPSILTEKNEQENIFQELLKSFEEKTVVQTKNNIDTAEKNLLKSKHTIQKLQLILQAESQIDNKETFIAEIKKLELTNNSTTIHDSLKNIIRNLTTTYRHNAAIMGLLKPIASDLGIFIAPKGYYVFLEQLKKFFSFLQPLIHTDAHLFWTSTNNLPAEITFETIQNNTHIHTLLRNAYRGASYFHLTHTREKQAYFYSLYRSQKLSFFIRKARTILSVLFSGTILSIIAVTCMTIFAHEYIAVFVTNSAVMLFVILSLLSLVIHPETV